MLISLKYMKMLKPLYPWTGVLCSVLITLLVACSDADTAQVTTDTAPANSTAKAVSERAVPIEAVRNTDEPVVRENGS
jgi:hypothetical protein